MYLLTALAAILIMTALIQLEPGILVGAPSTDVTDDWPMFRHDSQRTGYSAFTAPSTNEIKWFYNTSKEIDSAPTVANGRVVVGLSNGNVLALNSTTGERLWIYDTGAGSNSIWGSPAVDSGRVYIGTRDRNLYCLNEATGELLWKYLTGGEIDSSPLVSDGKVFFGSMDGKLYCIDASDGSAVWNFNTSGGIYSSPAILNGVVFTGSYDSKLYAVNALNGVEVWNYSASSASDAIDCSPAISNGKIGRAHV